MQVLSNFYLKIRVYFTLKMKFIKIVMKDFIDNIF